MSNGYQLARRRLLAKRRAALTRESWNKSSSPDLSPSRGVQFDFTNVPKDMLNEQRKHLLHLIKKVCERNDAILVRSDGDDLESHCIDVRDYFTNKQRTRFIYLHLRCPSRYLVARNLRHHRNCPKMLENKISRLAGML